MLAESALGRPSHRLGRGLRAGDGSACHGAGGRGRAGGPSRSGNTPTKNTPDRLYEPDVSTAPSSAAALQPPE